MGKGSTNGHSREQREILSSSEGHQEVVDAMVFSVNNQPSIANAHDASVGGTSDPPPVCVCVCVCVCLFVC